MHLAAQLIGSTVAVGLFVLAVYCFPRTINESSWREERRSFEKEMKNRITLEKQIDIHSAKFDLLLSLANITQEQIECIFIYISDVVDLYSASSFPNEFSITYRSIKFVEKWNEENARAIFLSNILLIDHGIAKYPTKYSSNISTILAALGMVLACVICASMIAVYRRVVYSVFYYNLGMHNATSKASRKYIRSSLSREGVVLAIAIAGLIFAFCQMAAFAYLQSGKTWPLGTALFWACLQLIGVGNMRSTPAYMNGKISLWLSVVDFASYLNAAAAIGFVIVSALRCCESRESIGVQKFTDDEINKVLVVDKERSRENGRRVLFHN